MTRAETLSDHEVRAALQAVDTVDAPDADKADMLVEIAMGLQQRPRHPAQLEAAVSLYDRALELCADETLAAARIRARRATALQMLPGGRETLTAALQDLQAARPALERGGSAEETAECDMNLGLVLQSLGRDLGVVVQAYQRALRVFGRDNYPREYAILHSNLAAAYLAMPLRGEADRMREAMAVQSFETALSAVNIIEHPGEYAMLQNNLGNALQYAASDHPLENNLRALQAYEEALRVRSERDTPGEYANTLANMANCLANLPDEPGDPSGGNPRNRERAVENYRMAQILFERLGETDKAALVAAAIAELEGEGDDAVDG